MTRLAVHFLFGLLLLFFFLPVRGQDSTVGSANTAPLPGLLRRAGLQAAHFQQQLRRQSGRYLAQLARQERTLQRLLARRDTAAARSLLAVGQSHYRQLRAKLRQPGPRDTATERYSSRLDSVYTALRFLQQEGLGAPPQKVAATLARYQDLQGTLNQTGRLRQFVQQRQQQLQTGLQPYGLTKPLQRFQKQAYYYQAQVSAYQQVLTQPTKREQKLLGAVRQLPAFQAYFREHSQLATLFRLPVDPSLLAPGTPIPGLQTVAGLQEGFTQKFGQEAKVGEAIQQQIQAAQGELNGLKNKLAAAGTPADIPMPDFKPNHQKTKTFWQRLEVGGNVQSTRSTTYFPVTTDVGFSLGYKLHDKAVTGLGSNYKVGWGQDFRHLHLSQQGVGLRSFLDFQLRQNFWLTGGAELQYRSQQSDELRTLSYYQPWQKLALVGLTKKYKINERLKGKMQLLYDFLHQQQLPRTQALLFRVGYQF